MAAQWHGRGKGVGGPKWKGGRAVSCGHAARGDASGGWGPVPAADARVWRRRHPVGEAGDRCTRASWVEQRSRVGRCCCGLGPQEQ
jgi:hypothetical protein